MLFTEGSEILCQLFAGSVVAVLAILDGVCGTQVCLLVLKSVTEVCDDLQIKLILENYRLRRKHTWKRCYIAHLRKIPWWLGPQVQDCSHSPVNQLVGHKNSKAPLGLGNTLDVLLP